MSGSGYTCWGFAIEIAPQFYAPISGTMLPMIHTNNIISSSMDTPCRSVTPDVFGHSQVRERLNLRCHGFQYYSIIDIKNLGAMRHWVVNTPSRLLAASTLSLANSLRRQSLVSRLWSQSIFLA